MQRELHDIRPPLPQRRDLDGDHLEAIVEVLAEMPLRHILLQVTVGGGNHADADLYCAGPSHALELTLLENAQEKDLGGMRDVTDFVQKDRASVGKFEPADPALMRPGEGPLLVPEQFALEDPLGEGRAIDLDKGPVPEMAVAVDGDTRII